jgi:hypothetical protein
VILPGTYAASGKGGSILPGPDAIAGGSFSTDVKDARSFEIGPVSPSA